MTETETPLATRESPRGSAVSAAVVAACAALLLYAPRWWGVLGHGFVNYDDPILLGPGNPAISRGFAGFLELLDPLRSPQFQNAWLPLYYGSLSLDHALFGPAPAAFHLHSVLLHAACAAMVALLGRRLGLGSVAAAVAGIAYAVHPAATENVAWVASRKDVLSFLWMTFAAWFYLRGTDERRRALHAAGALCLAVSLTAKGSTLVLPLLLAAHALGFHTGDERRARLRAITPYAVVALLMTGLHLWIARREGTAGAAEESGLGALLVADLAVVWRYAVVLVLPLRQSVEWGLDPAAIDGTQALCGAAVLVALGAAVAVLRRGKPAVAAGLVAVVLALAPFNNLFPRTSVLFAERYAHIALLPLALLTGALFSSRTLAGVLVAAWAAISVVRLPVWRDATTLWTDAVEKAPTSALARMQLADALAANGRENPAEADAWNARAEAAWRDAIPLARTDLDRMRAEEGLGTHLLTTAPGGQTTEARVREAQASLGAALSRLSNVRVAGERAERDRAARRALILWNRAATYEQLGEADAALADWQEAVKSDPSSAQAWTGLARMYFVAGRAKEASEALAKSASLAPSDPSLARQRAELRIQGQDVAGAKAEFEQVLAAHPLDYDTLVQAARLDAAISRPVDAEKRFRRALEARPGDPVAMAGVAAALVEQAQAQCARDDLESARAAARTAAEFAPASSAPPQMLAIVERRAGNLEEATIAFRRAYELQPDGQRIREALASVLLERAVIAFDAHEDGTGDALAEEASQIGAAAVATRFARLETGVSGWPPAAPGASEKSIVTRRAALRALAMLSVGRPGDAAPELALAERGSQGGDAAVRRNVLRLLVRTRFLSGRPDDAVAAAEEFPKLTTPDDPASGWADLASAYIERGIRRRASGDAAGSAADFEHARELLDTAAAHGLPAGRRFLRRGEICFAEEKFVEATREFDLAAEASPRDVEPLLDRAAVWRTHFLLEEDRAYLDGAERDLRAALAVAPGDPRAMASLGEVLVLATKPSEAYPWLQRALLADPSQVTARRLLVELSVRAGRSHLEKKELKDARDVADRAVALDAPIPDALVFLGDVLRAQGDWPKALDAYRRAEAIAPEHPEVRAALCRYHLDLGHVYLLKGRRREAAESFLASQRIDTKGKVDVTSAKDRLHGIAVSAFQDGLRLRGEAKLKEAAEAFETSLLAEPTHEGRFDLGLVLVEMGEFERAEKAYAEALLASPTDVPTRLEHASVLIRLGRWDEAEKEYGALAGDATVRAEDRTAAERRLRWIAEQRAEMEKEPPK